MRSEFLPFAKPVFGDEEIQEVVETLKSGWITTGPRSQRFEEDLKAYNGVPFCLAMNSATTGLEMALQALGIGEGDEIITTAMTFVCTLSVAVLQGAVPVLVDIDRATMNIDVERIEEAITPRTKAIMPVHFTGLPCEMERIWQIAQKHGLAVIEDAAQAMGATYTGQRIGADPRSAFTVYSFHPNKNMTTGEGGAMAFHNPDFEPRIKRLRFHGIEKDAWKRFAKEGSPHYEVLEPARKANFMDIQAALGIHQLKKLDAFNTRRKELFHLYLEKFRDVEELTLPVPGDAIYGHCYHLFVLRMRPCKLGIDRDAFVDELKARNIGTGIHYRAPHLFPFYQDFYQAHPSALPKDGLPHAEWSADRLMSLPLWPGMTDQDLQDVVDAVLEVVVQAKATVSSRPNPG